MALRALFRRREDNKAADALYRRVVEQARQPDFYTWGGVPDTLDGRFDMVVLHGFLLLHRLKDGDAPAAELSQAVYDAMFADLDRSLREMGVGDISVPKQIKRMVSAFHGRIAAYDPALDGDEDALAEALRRNLYGTISPGEQQVALMVEYVRREAAALAARPISELLEGRLAFGPPPGR
jgi:cytochrome b pre-mRNA-processing protein 3